MMEEGVGIEMDLRYRLVYLKPGEIHVTKEPTFITTLLGSCVSVCLYSITGTVGAMSHSVLPNIHNYGQAGSDVRFVECAIENMLSGLSDIGIPRGSIRAKMFGGAEMFHRSGAEIRLARIVGDGNIKAARDILKARGIEIVSECVGGNFGRRLVFNTVTGEVLVRSISRITDEINNEAAKGRAA